MEALKRYLLKNFEQVFVLLILLSVSLITYFIPYKLAFLNMYYIPMLLAAYYLGTRSAMLGGVLLLVMVSTYAWLYPDRFATEISGVDLAANILTWGCFLILSGAAVGYLNRQLKEKMYAAAQLDAELTDHRALLEKTTRELIEYSEQVETKVEERTDVLQKSKEAVEDLKHRVEEALYATMDATVVKLMIEKRLRTEKRRISVMFCDLQGFTQYMEERQAEVVIADLNKFLAEVEETLFAYKAHLDKYIGDGVMAEFGAPVNYERHTLMAVMAGLKMQEGLAYDGFPWQMRVGIATGEPIIGLIGHKRQSYTALGDVVNVASRIEELCVPGKVTIDEATYVEVRDFFDVTQRVMVPSAQGRLSLAADTLSRRVERLEQDPDNVNLLKQIGALCLGDNDPVGARSYFKRALELNPDNDELKVAYAETALKIEASGEVELRGRKKRLHLYEVTGLKDPLADRDKIPPALYERYANTVYRLMEYPANLVLPVECLDGSVGHSRVVGFLSYAIADTLDLLDQDRRDILEAGYLADIGKTIIPHHLLNRRGSLSQEEFGDVMKHSRESVRKLTQMGYRSQAVFDIVEAHHEQWAGGGYPAGLRGEEIPLGARIVAVADAYSALTSWRPYHERWEYRGALSEIEQDTRKGTFDPRVVECLVGLLEIASPSEGLAETHQLV